MTLTPENLALLQRCQSILNRGFQKLPEQSARPIDSASAEILEQAALRLHDNFPYQHPYYLGQMLRPPHAVAQLAYALAMSINPNNHAHDGGRASSAMEVEAVAQLAAMFEWKTHLGHLCGGGTMANFEALWVAREMTNGRPIVASSQAHYTHQRLASVLGVPFYAVNVDATGRMDLSHLSELLIEHNVGTVVATLGTTGLGAVDPLAEIAALKQQHGFRLHVDAAYGGYFRLATNLSVATTAAFTATAATDSADSLVIDPHKHGLQPYGCGCVLFRERSVAAIYKHESPYTYFTSNDLHLGEISLECSRPGAAAVALWTTQQRFPLVTKGEFARDLESCREAALQLRDWVKQQPKFHLVCEPELDIVVWCPVGATSSHCSQLSRQFFDAAAQRNVHLALVSLPRTMLEPLQLIPDWDSDSVTCLRACVMKPEHQEWMPAILEELNQCL